MQVEVGAHELFISVPLFVHRDYPFGEDGVGLEMVGSAQSSIFSMKQVDTPCMYQG